MFNRTTCHCGIPKENTHLWSSRCVVTNRSEVSRRSQDFRHLREAPKQLRPRRFHMHRKSPLICGVCIYSCLSKYQPWYFSETTDVVKQRLILQVPCIWSTSKIMAHLSEWDLRPIEQLWRVINHKNHELEYLLYKLYSLYSIFIHGAPGNEFACQRCRN